jgi:hypothetical protein
MSFHPLFTVEIGFYMMMVILITTFMGFLFHVYISIVFYFSKYDMAAIIKRNKHYFSGENRVYYDRASVFSSKEKSNEDERKLGRLSLSNTSCRLKYVAGVGYFVRMTKINNGLLLFLALIFLLVLFLHGQSSSYIYFYGIKLPEVKEVFL